MSDRACDAFREIDHRTPFASCVNWLGTLENGTRAQELLGAELHAATGGRPSHAVLMLPDDTLGTPARETAPATGADATRALAASTAEFAAAVDTFAHFDYRPLPAARNTPRPSSLAAPQALCTRICG